MSEVDAVGTAAELITSTRVEVINNQVSQPGHLPDRLRSPANPSGGAALAEKSSSKLDEVSEIAGAVAALPLPDDDTSQRWHLRSVTAAWLASRKSRHTRRAYWRDLADYLSWCDSTGLDPRHARRADVDAYTVARCGHLSPTSTARRLSAVSSWYDYLTSNDVAARNPVSSVDRPAVDRDSSSTVAMTADETARFLAAARARTTRNARRDCAVLSLLATLGARVGEVLALDVEDLGHDRGHRVVDVRGKGGKRRRLPIPPLASRDLDNYLAERSEREAVPVDQISGPLLVTSTGKRLDEPSVFLLVRRVAAAAGIANAAKLSPHSLRHAAATTALDAGSPLRDVQDLLGHADPRTTRRYDRGRGSLDRSPTYALSAAFAMDEKGG